MKYKFKLYTSALAPTAKQIKATADFLAEHLDQYGDPAAAIAKAIKYAVDPNKGGIVLELLDNEKIIGAVVINDTGMADYIPENILVYIAVDKSYRGQGLGKELMKKALSLVKGSVALHVEENNPAKGLYEHLGFQEKYREMRLIR